MIEIVAEPEPSVARSRGAGHGAFRALAGSYRFVIVVALSAVPGWLIGILAAIQSRLTLATDRTVAPWGIAGLVAVGVAASVLHGLTVRRLDRAVPSGMRRRALRGIALLAFATLFWAGAQGVAGTPTGAASRLPEIPATLVAVVGLAGLLIGEQARRLTAVASETLTTRRRSRRAARFAAQAKLLRRLSTLDAQTIAEALAKVELAYRRSPTAGALLVRRLRAALLVAADPRYAVPQPLPLALRLTDQAFPPDLGEDEDASITVDARPDQRHPQALLLVPQVLVRLIRFVGAYGVHHGQRRATVTVSYSETPSPSLLIESDVRRADRSFILPEDSGADLARTAALDAIEATTPGGARLDLVEPDDQTLCFRLFLDPIPDRDSLWRSVELTLGAGASLVSHCDLSSGRNRVYRRGDRIEKVEMYGPLETKAVGLAEERELLRHLEDLPEVPRAERYSHGQGFGVLTLQAVPGERLDRYLGRAGGARREWFRCLADLTSLLERVHRRGVAHRDLRPENILVDEAGGIHLVDFDQGTRVASDAWRLELGGVEDDEVPIGIAFPRLLKLLDLEDEYREVVSLLRRAWTIAASSSASSPGRELAYYGWRFGSESFPGERPWSARWATVAPALTPLLSGARVLDLGCNLGLAGVFCSLNGAAEVVGVDRDEEILGAASLVADAAGVQVTPRHGDLESRPFMEGLAREEFDVTILLSVLHWLNNRSHVYGLLETASAVVFEGHRGAREEEAELRRLGFGVVQLLGYSERFRAVFLATRDAREVVL